MALESVDYSEDRACQILMIVMQDDKKPPPTASATAAEASDETDNGYDIWIRDRCTEIARSILFGRPIAPTLYLFSGLVYVYPIIASTHTHIYTYTSEYAMHPCWLGVRYSFCFGEFHQTQLRKCRRQARLIHVQAQTNTIFQRLEFLCLTRIPVSTKIA